jgi:hypothetical protein
VLAGARCIEPAGRTIDEPHQVAVCTAVDVLQCVAQPRLGLHRAVVKANDVLEAVQLPDSMRVKAQAEHLYHDGALRDFDTASQSPTARAQSVEGLEARIRQRAEGGRQLLPLRVLHRVAAAVTPTHEASRALRVAEASCSLRRSQTGSSRPPETVQRARDALRDSRRG